MLFNSFGFIFLFLPVALIGFFSISRLGRGYGGAWLVLMSFLFYGMWNPRFVALLVLSIGFNFTMGELIHEAAKRPRRQRALLAAGIGGDLLALAYYKYFYAMLGFFGSVGLLHVAIPPIVLPLGISFFTFTQIGYLADVQQGVTQERGALKYVLFVTFFPHLIAGPILHNRDIMPQFARAETYRFSTGNFTAGFVIFIIGLAKKCILADPIAASVHTGFAATGHLQLFAAWFTVLSFALQLYFDFSGYTDMAIGIARMFNIEFPINFDSPFKATSIIDHWHRWHITLSRFLNLYLYSPVALAITRYRMKHGMRINRKAQKRPGAFLAMVALPFMVTMGLAGIWHGAGPQFLIFGLLHGSYLTINHAWRIARPPATKKPGRLEIAASFALTFLCVLVAFVFFRAPSLSSAVAMLGGMAGLHGIDWSSTPVATLLRLASAGMAGSASDVAFTKTLSATVQQCIADGWVVLLCVIVWAFPNTQQIMSVKFPRNATSRPSLVWRPTIGWAATIGAMGAVALLTITGTSEFLYYQF